MVRSLMLAATTSCVSSCSSQGGTGSGNHAIGSHDGSGGGCGFHVTTNFATGETIECGVNYDPQSNV
jgi:hypothetical protein